MSKSKSGIRLIVAIGIGSALFFLVGAFVSIPVFANTKITFQYAILGFFAAVFGPIAGLLIGLIGHSLIDLSMGYGLWFSWIIVSGIVGLGYGLIMKNIDIEAGIFGKKGVLRFIIGGTIIQFISWGVIAPLLDILIYQEPANKVFTQGIISSCVNSLAAGVIGTLLLLAYSKTRTKTASLELEKD